MEVGELELGFEVSSHRSDAAVKGNTDAEERGALGVKATADTESRNESLASDEETVAPPVGPAADDQEKASSMTTIVDTEAADERVVPASDARGLAMARALRQRKDTTAEPPSSDGGSGAPSLEPAQVQEERLPVPAEAIQGEPGRVDPVLPPELVGTWQGIPGTLEGLDGMLDLQGANRFVKMLVVPLASKAKPKLEIRGRGSMCTVAQTNHKGTDIKEFALDDSPFQTTLDEGNSYSQGEGRGSLRRTTLVLRVENAEGSRTTEWHVEGGHLLESVCQTRGKGSAIMKRKYERLS